MRTVKVFIAGSKELKAERSCLKVLGADLNNFYSKKGVQVLIHSYENFNDKQEAYNQFIEQEADIVFFILDGHIGPKTEDEFLRATEFFNKENHPEVMVFLHEYDEITPGIARIQGLMKARLDDRYCIEYSNIDQIKLKASKRIAEYIEQTNVEPHTEDGEVPPPPPTEPGAKGRKVRILLYSVIGILAVLAGCLIWQLCVTPVQLVFAGGGSVKNFIEEEKGIDIVEYPHSVYLNMPSGNAWSLLAEEISREQESGGETKNPFSTICFSADDIDSTSVFNGRTETFLEKHKIFKYYLGEDPLVVYVSRDFVGKCGIKKEDTLICIDSLRALLKYVLSSPVSGSVYTTSRSSGTLRAYQSCFALEDSLEFEMGLSLEGTKKVLLFNKNSEANYIRTKPYIVLGSKYYYPTELIEKDKGRYLSLYVYGRGGCIGKPMNLYFLGKKEDNNRNSDYCIIKKSIIDFLKAIHAEKNMDPAKWNKLKSGRVPVGPGNVEELNGKR